MAIYETVAILDSLLPTKDIDDIIERCSTVIKENGGSVRGVDKWGKRRLAYEIQKKQYGFYFALEFEGEGDIPKALQSEYNYNDNVLRYLTYKYDKHKLKAMEQAPAVKQAVADAPVKVEEVKEVKEVKVAAAVEEEEKVEVTPTVVDEPIEAEVTAPLEEEKDAAAAEAPSEEIKEEETKKAPKEEGTEEAKDE